MIYLKPKSDPSEESLVMSWLYHLMHFKIASPVSISSEELKKYLKSKLNNEDRKQILHNSQVLTLIVFESSR